MLTPGHPLARPAGIEPASDGLEPSALPLDQGSMTPRIVASEQRPVLASGLEPELPFGGSFKDPA